MHFLVFFNYQFWYNLFVLPNTRMRHLLYTHFRGDGNGPVIIVRNIMLFLVFVNYQFWYNLFILPNTRMRHLLYPHYHGDGNGWFAREPACHHPIFIVFGSLDAKKKVTWCFVMHGVPLMPLSMDIYLLI